MSYTIPVRIFGYSFAIKVFSIIYSKTISRKLAAKNGTEANYKAALKEQSKLYGIDISELDKIENPMLIFEPDIDMPYTTETFSKFNV